MRGIGHLRIGGDSPDAFGQVLFTCAQFSNIVEPDGRAVFVDLSASRGLWRELLAQTAALAPEAALGLATSKLVARVASDVAHQRECDVVSVRPGNEAQFLQPLPVESLWMADSSLSLQLQSLGITYIGQLAEIPCSVLVQRFGQPGRLLYNWSHGIDPSPVEALYPPKAIEHSLSFTEQPLTPGPGLMEAVSWLASAVSRQLTELGQGCMSLCLTLRGSSGNEYQRDYKPASAQLSQPDRLHRAAIRLLGLLSPPEPVQHLVLRAENLATSPVSQYGLFAAKVEPNHTKLTDTVESVCDRFGAQAIQKASGLTTPRRERFMAALEQLWLG